MSGVTDVGMRRIARRFGASLVVSEMVASDDYVRGDEETRIRAEGDGVEPHVVQIAGCDPYWMGEAARLAESSGAAMVDINMGCPAKRVTGGYAGSALMRDLDHAIGLVRATVAAVGIPVTLKMRLGWDDQSRNAPELARRAEAEGVRLVTVHGRTRCQFYNGQADWTAIRAVRDA
ncbi:MAG: tRNA-dihydrouridine synthase family protein, partial [Beijerinckiaceae bacterium]|nr:tRNA-dihydrouridine synthase family protein [Beijerinckiaceae bacterium]